MPRRKPPSGRKSEQRFSEMADRSWCAVGGRAIVRPRFIGATDSMLEIVQAGGWLMVPIIACSIIAAAIILERLWTLQEKRVLPKHIVSYVREDRKSTRLNSSHVKISYA